MMGAVREDEAAGKPWIVLVGGFLGAGKTTLLVAAAAELKRRGMRSAIILNDQSEGLVDSKYSTLQGLDNAEVTGGCFCCRFSELVERMDQLCKHKPHVIFAEPVGSCTDISATILHPLREYLDTYRIAPFTVLVDPKRAEELLCADADQNLAYLFKKQLEEADLICATKSDISPVVPRLGARAVRQMSARTGQGVAAWLDEVLAGDLEFGEAVLEIDYAQYAQAEAALAWLNLQVGIRSRVPASPAMILGPLLDRLDRDFTAAGVGIVHLKAIVTADSGFVKAAVCGNGQEPEVEGALDASPSSRHDLLLNLRALGGADAVRAIVERALGAMEAELVGMRIQCFHPAAPKPERRFASA
jgi:hypothetical protein